VALLLRSKTTPTLESMSRVGWAGMASKLAYVGAADEFIVCPSFWRCPGHRGLRRRTFWRGLGRRLLAMRLRPVLAGLRLRCRSFRCCRLLLRGAVKALRFPRPVERAPTILTRLALVSV